jgi:N,N'-diacetyllegionaminate synthase
MFINKDTKKTFIIAEVGNNHEGNISVAKKLINLASKAGVDAIKFQTFITEKFINKDNKKRFNQLKRFELSFKQFKILKDLANKKKLKFVSTPLDLKSANFLIKNSDIIKVASSDNNFFPLLDIILKSKKKVIISTGMTSIKNILNLISYISKKIGTKKMIERISLLHCVTSYPVEDKYVNLNSIAFLKEKTNLTIGYSDHSLGFEACMGAVVLGAQIVEKHFTIDKNFSDFRDHKLSADFYEMKKIVDSIRKIELQLGKFNKTVLPVEKKIIKDVRRGVYAKSDLLKGEQISLNNVEFYRVSEDKDFLNLKDIVGKEINKKIKKNKIIKKNDII